MPFAIQPWARYLDLHRVLAFRSVHGRFTVAAVVLFVAGGAAAHAAAAGAGRRAAWRHRSAAGSLGWTLGHNDFAPRGEETRYMALHVTLTGMRGLVAPPLDDRAVSPARAACAPDSVAAALLLPMLLRHGRAPIAFTSCIALQVTASAA